ncbi:MAG: hypothetical protein ABI411_12710 [Tahibacter sp.]
MKSRLLFAFLVTSFLALPSMAQTPATPGPQYDNGSQPPSALGRKKDKGQADQNAPQADPSQPQQTAGRRTAPTAQTPPAPPQDGKKKKHKKDGDE